MVTNAFYRPTRPIQGNLILIYIKFQINILYPDASFMLIRSLISAKKKPNTILVLLADRHATERECIVSPPSPFYTTKELTPTILFISLYWNHRNAVYPT